MEQQLRQIYVDLSSGRLSRQDALEQIKAIKLRSGVLLAAPLWRTASIERHDARFAETHMLSLLDARHEQYAEHALTCFERVQSILRGRPRGRVLLQVVISDEVLFGLSALLKTAALENPLFTGQVILGGADPEAETYSAETVIRYDHGVREVLRWEEIDAHAEPAVAFRNDGVYLITGGQGAIGRLVGQEIAQRAPGARVIAAGRRELDVTDDERVERFIGDILREHGRLNGIVHCAGTLADDFILRQSRDDFARVLAPKVAGTLNLDRATRRLALDFMVLFSSFAGAMGNIGQAGYAAANAFMDGFAAHRNRTYGRTLSINWPLWQAGGMQLDAATRESVRRTTGLQPMQTATAMRALHGALASMHDRVMPGEGDVAQMRRVLLAAPAVVTAKPAPPFVPPSDLAAKTQEFLCRELSAVLKMPAERIDPHAALEEYGIDSLLAMRLTNQLEQTFGTLSKTLFFEYQTIAALTQYLVESHAARLNELFEARPAAVVAPPPPSPRRRERVRAARTEGGAIAIIGLSGRYPQAIDVEAYWRNLRDGRDCITEVPKHRWDWREYYSADRAESGKHYSKWGGFIDGVDEFDPLFFNISPKEAKLIDPQERLFLQHAWMALEDAGYTRAALQSSSGDDLPGQVGVYAGLMYNEYQLLGGHGSAASIANRVSYVLNLHGPSLTLDTMCSSSLTAIHLASLDLKSGCTSMAIAGGVNVSIHPNKYLQLSAGQFISGDGHCQSFGEGGDGYIPGEGVGVVVLKRLADAERDGDHVYGIIRGSALNHGGKTNGYTVPNPHAQASAIGRALSEARVDARLVSYVEAHGTGTKLGDPIEIAALTKAFAKDTKDTGFCLIGSAKSNVGHCESAAGIAGLTKVLLQMQHHSIAPSLHSAQLNPHIDFAATPFVVNQSLRPWEQPLIDGRRVSRIAGLSSFGAGGSNAHLIVEEYQPPAVQPVRAAEVLIPLSARTPEQLQQKAADLLEFLRTHTVDLVSVAYTLQVGREAMDERLAFVASSGDELLEQLRTQANAYRGRAKRQGRAAEWSALSDLAALWVEGFDVDWHRLYGHRPRRVSLPLYPFARERYWIDAPVKHVAPAAPAPAPPQRARIKLSDVSAAKLHDRGNGIFALEASGNLRQALERAAQEPSLQVLLLSGLEQAEADLQAIASFPFPIVAVLRGDATGRAFLAAAHCDFMVCNENAHYGCTPATTAEATFLAERFSPGDPTCPRVPAANVDAHAEILAQSLAAQSRDALRLLKQHLTLRIDDAPEAAARVPGDATVVHYKQPLPRDASAIVLVIDDAVIEDRVVFDLQRVIFQTTIPIVAALTGSANGNAWLIALLCDGYVCSRDGIYSAAGLLPAGAGLFARRLGYNFGAEVVLTGSEYRAADLPGAIVADDVLSVARSVAQSAVVMPRVTLSDDAADDMAAAPAAFQSDVVTVTPHPGGVVVVKMEDREARNMFSAALIEGVTAAFEHIARNPAYKVVVLTGYDTHFAAGGTKETLLAIQEGRTRFTDVKVFQLPLDCRLPVIAAMQGHAIGAGWALGMFADVALMSEESRYVSPYMNYGFTPGAGATWILARKIGHDLARESLFSARQSIGSDFKQRGLRLPILPRHQVLPAAMELARRIARHSRERLVALKHGLTHGMHEAAEATYRRELAMHEQTFVGRSETRARIDERFAGSIPARTSVPVVPQDAGLIATLKTLLANELQMRESDIDDHAPFIDLGLDSISGVSWIRRINETYQISIEATQIYSHPTLQQLSAYVCEQLPAAPQLHAAEEKARVVQAPVCPASPQRIAIIGMAGQFPQANSLDDFWRNLAEGRDCVTTVPRERWDVDEYYQPGDPVPGKTNSEWLGGLEEYDRFDPLFFNISPTEAEAMDPQQRLFLQACWHGIEDAGYDARALSGSRTGVFVGCAAGDYAQLSRKHRLSAQGFTGNAASILAARISYFLDLQGPCVPIDTACSSSLVAIAQACDSLNNGDSDLALAGGVYVMAGPEMHLRTAAAGMLSPNGRCYAFDERADGFVPGEGAGVVVLKRLADAERDGDRIEGVIDGWGVNQDGRTNGITAPNPHSQTRLMQHVYDKYAIDPANIQLVEAHGTGTRLGDPIEVAGLKASFRKYTQKKHYCAIGSVKSNIGHCLTAAGIAGVIKLLLALKHRQLPPTIHFQRLNEHIDLADSPFFINDQLRDWTLDGATRRMAAISSFGFSGTNAHLVIGEWNTTAGQSQTADCLIPLSARTPEQLEQKVCDLLAFLRRNPSAEVGAVAYTLQVGRQPMDERLGLVASSIAELIEKLETRNGVLRGRVQRNRDDVHHDESRPLESWINGMDVDWNRLHGDDRPQRISLPLYPFAKDRYWIEAEDRPPVETLFATPLWQTAALEPRELEYREHHVLSLSGSYDDAALQCFERVQSILRDKPAGKVLLQVVADDERFAGLGGLLRTATLENPQFNGQIILGPADRLDDEKRHGADTVVRYDNGTRQVLRWQEVASSQNGTAFKAGGVYLITGGRGALGKLFAREIERHGGRSIAIGREIDLADLAALRRFIEQTGRIDGILHCAGMIADNFIPNKTAGELRRVLAPKVAGTINLDLATQHVELDFFVLFSSVAGVFGFLGQADYAAANGFMDRFAAWRNRLVASKQRRGRTRSINWPLWEEGGIKVDAASRELARQTMGVQPMRTEAGLQAFHHSLALEADQTLVVSGDREAIRSYLRRARIFEPTAQIPQAPAAPVDATQLLHDTTAMVASIVGIAPSSVDLDQPFVEIGLDSFLGADLIVRLNQKFGTQLSHSRLFDYSTVRLLARFLEQEIAKLPARQPIVTIEPEPARGPDEKIAIIGMSGRYPGANDLDQFWDNLAAGRNSIVEIPKDRWDADRHYDPERGRKGKTYSKWLGAVDDVDRFDPLFFRISPQEAEFIDPQQRLFLQESYRAFENAGYSTATLSNTKCGVYLGISTSDYMTLLSHNGISSAPVTSNSYAIAAARIAYYLNLKGPAISVDTACSSSLVAIHLACQAMLNGEIDMALAGGVTLWLRPESYVAMSHAGMFSPDGQCKTFDDAADGIVNGDGVGVVVLKRLSDAQRDGDPIWGVILGSAINQDGRTNGITAPSVNSQIELERGLYAKYGIDPETITYVEAHGTGTRLGDPIELEALATVFSETTQRKNFCALGSVKTNIGHTTSAAGVAGAHKVLLSMRHKTLVPSLNIRKESSRFDFADSPFYISRETKPWISSGPRRAAVSSFGFSGTNAHLVLEEYQQCASPAGTELPLCVPLSARTAEQLRQKAADLLRFIQQTQEPLDLASIAYTLQTGREPMEERLAFAVSSIDELNEKLNAWLNEGRTEQAPQPDAWTGSRPRRIALPGYPFAKERCWFDDAQTASFSPSSSEIEAIEDIFDRLGDDAIASSDAVQALKMLI